MRFTRPRDACRSENQVTRFASGQPDFLSPRSLLRRLTARGRRDERLCVRLFPNASLRCALG
ncbi:hypothetical protein [Tannerella forsythia]|uniref:hypothetical protein n=1 Tax=Tannerella forsythia TaxID=28112 RepID=UPI000AC857C8|nr:hypothetical protein [Tannerella forsythia]